MLNSTSLKYWPLPSPVAVPIFNGMELAGGGCLSKATTLAMVFKFVEAAQKSWRRLDGHNQLPKVVLGAKFTDGLDVATADPQSKAAA